MYAEKCIAYLVRSVCLLLISFLYNFVFYTIFRCC